MPQSNVNKQALIKTLGSLPLLAGRFSNIEVVNCHKDGSRKYGQGVLSVVFRAQDSTTGKHVAIKFLDPDLDLRTSFRIDHFRLEADFLAKFTNSPRILKLVSPLSTFDLNVSNGDTGTSISHQCLYFVVEWLDGDVDKYFKEQERYEAIIKLELFRNITLAVFALHSVDVAHRDIKADNFRAFFIQQKEYVVAIDLGTATLRGMPAIGTQGDYSRPVGALAYAPLEARQGLAGIHDLAVHTDMHALGCLLHDLFNADLFFSRQIRDSGYLQCIAVTSSIAPQGLSDESKLIAAYSKLIRPLKRNVCIPRINEGVTSLPAALNDLANMVLAKLVAVDFTERLTNKNQLIRYIDSMLSVLNNERFGKKKLFEKRKNRLEDQRRAAEKQARLTKRINQIPK